MSIFCSWSVLHKRHLLCYRHLSFIHSCESSCSNSLILRSLHTIVQILENLLVFYKFWLWMILICLSSTWLFFMLILNWNKHWCPLVISDELWRLNLLAWCLFKLAACCLSQVILWIQRRNGMFCLTDANVCSPSFCSQWSFSLLHLGSWRFSSNTLFDIYLTWCITLAWQVVFIIWALISNITSLRLKKRCQSQPSFLLRFLFLIFILLKYLLD